MSVDDLPKIDVSGIRIKLERAQQNIFNLNAEILAFFKESAYPSIPKTNDKLCSEAIQYHENRPIPKRFSVLAGEIVHHLRSCLDHLAWQLSTPAARASTGGRIEFPIFAEKPKPCGVSKDKMSRYCRKVEGIESSAAQTIIEGVQPYNTSKPAENPLWILHDLDRIDKHRELVIVYHSITLHLTANVISQIRHYKQAKLTPADDRAMAVELSRNVNMDAEFSPQISFRDFVQGEYQPVIPALSQLTKCVRDVIGIFVGDEIDR